MKDTLDLVTLGKVLVKELGPDRDSDTLSRWMSHYVAELIQVSNEAKGEHKAKAQKECFEAILELWSYRYELPNGKRPFEKFEPILRALEDLDPENERSRYWHPQPPKQIDDQDKICKHLEMAKRLDETARILVRSFIGAAAKEASDQSEPWVQEILKINHSESPDIELFRVMILDGEATEPKSAKEIEIEKIVEIRDKLLAFSSIAETMIALLNQKIETAAERLT